jgi:HlyD family secretion protein
MAFPRKRWILGVALLVLAGAGATVYWRGRAVPVDVLQVRLAPLVRSVQFSARVQALSRVDIGATVTGRVAQVLVDEGAQVREGAELVRLEAQELRAALAQALAAQQQAAARLAGLRSTGRSSAGAALAQAQATVDAAQAEFLRVQQLVAQGFLSASRQDDARRARDVALAQRDSARAQAGAIGRCGDRDRAGPGPGGISRIGRGGWRARGWPRPPCAPRPTRRCWRATSSPGRSCSRARAC